MTGFTSKLFERLGVPHIFAGRDGGVSSGEAFGSLNVSSARTDKSLKTDFIGNVYENYKIIFSSFGLSPECAVGATQTHSDIIINVTNRDGGRGCTENAPLMPECDGVLLTKDAEKISAVCVKTADCVPILFADKASENVCAVHAGWRGTVKGIAARAIEAMEKSGSRRENIIAAIGPCIGMCCYEVGDEVAEAAKEALGGISDTALLYRKKNGKHMINLSGINREIMLREGILREHIDELGLCTCCHRTNGTPTFFSHRGTGGHSGAELSAVCRPLRKNY